MTISALRPDLRNARSLLGTWLTLGTPLGAEYVAHQGASPRPPAPPFAGMTIGITPPKERSPHGDRELPSTIGVNTFRRCEVNHSCELHHLSLSELSGGDSSALSGVEFNPLPPEQVPSV